MRFYQRGGLVNSKRRERLRSKEGYVWCNKRPSPWGSTLTTLGNILSLQQDSCWIPAGAVTGTHDDDLHQNHLQGINSSPQSNILSRPGSLCRFLRSDRISKASTTWQHGKTTENLYLTKVHKQFICYQELQENQLAFRNSSSLPPLSGCVAKARRR